MDDGLAPDANGNAEGGLTMDELKPCPFCGGKAYYNEKKLRIECAKCKANMPGVLSFKGVWNYKYYLARLWNRRTDNG